MIRKAIIPVAGMGTRFLPATKALAKEMFPIIDKPAIQYIVEEAVQSGIEEILFITNTYKSNIENHFDRNFELEKRLEKSEQYEELEQVLAISNLAKFYYMRQGEPLGTGHALLIAESFVQGEPFALLYGDDIISSKVPCLKQLIDIYEKYDCNVLCTDELEEECLSQKGVLVYENIETKKISGIIEKPNMQDAPSHDGVIGRYILKPEIFEELKKISLKNGEYLLTDAIVALMEKQPFYACRLEGNYYDIGSKIGYLKANIAFGLKNEDLHKSIQMYLEKIKKS